MIIGASFVAVILITITAIVIMLIVRHFCCVKNKGRSSSTHQTQILSNNPIFHDNGLVRMTYDDPPLYYTEYINDHNRLTPPILHGNNPVAISEEIGTNITPLDATYETIPNDVTTSSEDYYYISRPESDSTADYIVPIRGEGLSEQLNQINKNSPYNSSTTQSMSSPNMEDVLLEEAIPLNENVAYVLNKRSVDYLTVL